MERTRAWRVALEGNETSACGTLLFAQGRVAYTVVASAGPRLLALCDPHAVLGPELLSRVVERLPLRSRVRCTTVSRAWRDALRRAQLFSSLDLGRTSFPLPPGQDINAILRRCLRTHGHKLKELRLRNTSVTNDSLLIIAASCPRLRFLDLRDCSLVFSGEPHSRAGQKLVETVMTLFKRAVAGESFTLLLRGSGVTSYIQCGYLCEELLNAATASLALLRNLRGPDGMPWLRVDVAVCRPPSDLETCDRFFHEALDGVPEEDGDSFTCTGCGITRCDGCSWIHART